MNAVAVVLFGGFMFAISSASAGTLVGTVKAQPKPELQENQGAAGGKYESRKFKFVDTIKYDEIKDFVVYIDQPMTNKFPKQEVEIVTQQDAQFHPHVRPILVGSTVNWPNNDDIFHNVYSNSDAKTFDLGLYKSGETKKVDFDKPGRVDVFCSIHSQMNCVLLVLQNPYFAATDNRGKYKITNIPAGTYKIKAWHERLPGQVKEITIPAEGEVTVDFTVGVSNLSRASK
jgi:plastocyanin